MRSVFISSTFKDMQAERDYLHEKIFPRLRRLVGQYGEDIQELDLRWGVDTYKMSEEESGYQVLRVCIDAIDRCKPYIIVLLGDRYGWIPDVGVVESLRDDRVTDQYEESMSITNLEIKYGALSEEETLERCIFCFRNHDFLGQVPEDRRGSYQAESPEHERKLDTLKQQIRGKKEARIIEYEVQWDEAQNSLVGLEGLGEEIYLMLGKLLREELADRKAKDPIQQYLLDAECTKERYLSSYTARLFEEEKGIKGLRFMSGDKYSRYHSKIRNENGNEQCVHLTGGAGSGKSALIAYLEQQAKDAGAQTVLYFSGNPGCQSVPVLKSVLIYRMEEILGIAHNFQPENQNVYLRELDKKLEKFLVFCFIDALDQLFPDEKRAYLDILELCPNLFVITSSLDDFPYQRALMRARNVRIIEVQKFTNRDKKLLIQKTSACRGKKIDDLVETMICTKSGSGNPLFLSLLLQRLFAMRQEEFKEAETIASGMDGLHLYMQKMIEKMPEQAAEMAVVLFNRVSEMFGSTFFKKVTYLIALSGTGLSEREIGDIFIQHSLEISQLKFQEILCYLYDVFTEQEDGKWVFAHRIFYEAMMQDMGEEADTIRQYFLDYSAINEAFMEREGYVHILKRRDPLGKEVLKRCKDWNTHRKVEELVVQMLSQEEDSEAYFMEMLYCADCVEIEKLFVFWKSVGQSERDRKTLNFKRRIYESFCQREDISAELKVEALIKLMYEDNLEESERHIQKARVLIHEMQDSDSKSWKIIQIDYMEMWNLFDTDQIEEGLEILRSLIQRMEDMPGCEEAGEEVAVWYMNCCRLFAERSRKYRKESAAVYLEKALALSEKYPELARKRRILMAKIQIYLEVTLHYAKEDPERAKQSAKEAVSLARTLSDEDPSVEVLELLARTLNFYGHDVERENRYQYRYESLEVFRRAYQLVHTDYWQQKVAVQASFFARDISKLIQQQKLDDRGPWIRRGREAWDLSFAYFEELCEKKYVYVDREYYEDSLLERAQEEVFKCHVDRVISYAKRAYDLLKEDERNGRDARDRKGAERHWLAAALLAENLDEKLCVKEAVPYAYEQLACARLLWEQKRTQSNYGKLLAGLQIAGRVLYHAGENTHAYAYAGEGEELLLQYRKESGQVIPNMEAEFEYILGRISLKRNELEAAKKYQNLLEKWNEQGHLDFWMKGQLMLLKGDILFAQKEYEAARDSYVVAIEYWENVDEQIENNVKPLFYNLYAVWQKGEVIRVGGLAERSNGWRDSGHTRFKKEIDIYSFNSGTCREEYRYAFKICMEKAKEKEYRLLIERFLFRTMDRMLELGNQSGWDDWKYMDIFAFLCQMAGYCRKQNLNMDRELQIFTEAMCRYDLSRISTALYHALDSENYWIDIYEYMKKRLDEGMSILPCNKNAIGFLWLYFGCFEEAGLWFEQVLNEGDVRNYRKAKVYLLYSHAMCALRERDEEKLAELLTEIERRQGAEAGYLDTYVTERLYPELTGDEWKLLEGEGPFITQQERAQRYLNVLQMVVVKGKYFSADKELKKRFWEKLRKVRKAYVEGNTVKKGQEDVLDTWEDRALALKRLTLNGMTWQVDYKDLDEIIFTLLRELYASCSNKADKQEVAGNILDFWREDYQRIDLKGISLENLLVLREVEEKCGCAPTPALVEEISVRMDNKELLHEFFREIPGYSCKTDWKMIDRRRKTEIKDIFNRLLDQDIAEWERDFRQWIGREENLWIMKDMDFFKDPETTADDPEKSSLYEAYRDYMIRFTENSRRHFVENVQGCGMINKG